MCAPLFFGAFSFRPISDKAVFDAILRGDTNDTFLAAQVELLLQDFKHWGLLTQKNCLEFLGKRFRPTLPFTSQTSDEEAGTALIERYA